MLSIILVLCIFGNGWERTVTRQICCHVFHPKFTLPTSLTLLSFGSFVNGSMLVKSWISINLCSEWSPLFAGRNVTCLRFVSLLSFALSATSCSASCRYYYKNQSTGDISWGYPSQLVGSPVSCEFFFFFYLSLWSKQITGEAIITLICSSSSWRNWSLLNGRRGER